MDDLDDQRKVIIEQFKIKRLMKKLQNSKG